MSPRKSLIWSGVVAALEAAALLGPVAPVAAQDEADAAAPAAEPFAVTLTARAGGIEAVGRAYRAFVGADGNLHSLVVGETEMLDDSLSVSRGMYYYSDSVHDPGAPVQAGGDQVEAGDGGYRIGYEFRPDEIVITLRHEAPARTSYFAVLSKEIALAEDLDSHALATTPTTQPWGTVRFTAASGARLTLRGGSRIWGPWLGRQVWEVSNVPPSRDVRLALLPALGEPPQPTLGQLIGLEIAFARQDQIVPEGSRARMSAAVENRSDRRVEGAVALTVTAPGRGRIADLREAVAVPPGGHAAPAFAVSPPRPGFYEAAAALMIGEETVQRASATFGYAADEIISSSRRPDDFDAYWQQVAADARARPLEAEVARDSERSDAWVTVSKVTLPGVADAPVSGWLCTPPGAEALPGILLLPGYLAKQVAVPSALARKGYAVLAIAPPGGDVATAEPPKPYITSGLDDPGRYVYRAICADSLRALEWLAKQPQVDPARLAVSGPGQGGAVALILAAIRPGVAAVMCDVPLFCDMPRALEMARWPTSEIAAFIKAHPEQEAQALKTLSYFDLVHHAPQVKAPTLMSIGLRDRVSPPSTVYAAFNRLGGPKQISIYPKAGHEAGGSLHWGRKLDWLEQTLKAPPLAGSPRRSGRAEQAPA